MHGTINLKFIDAKKAKEIYQFKATKRKLYRKTQPYGTTKYADKND